MIRLTLFALLGCPKEEVPPEDSDIGEQLPEPGALEVGVATARMPIPLGIGTAGFNPLGVDSNGSPFAEIFPATEYIHNHPDFRVVWISRGAPYDVVFLRVDAIGVFQQLRTGIIEEFSKRRGVDLDNALIMAATHTHSGPGRLIDLGGPADIISDKFLPEHYSRMVDGMVDVLEAAYDDLKPGRVGYVFADATGAISDRRCEDGLDYENPTMPVLAVEQEGEIRAVVAALAIHGTVLGIDELHLSQDVSGGVEQAIEDGFDHPVDALMFNAWGADMAPGDPEVSLQTGFAWDGGYERMEAVGAVAADAVHEALLDVQLTDAPDLWSETYRVPINREVIGYDEETFKYDWGGVYCETAEEADCEASTNFFPELDDVCVPFNEEYHPPQQTLFTVGRIGDLFFTTFPGEGGTLLAEQIMGEDKGNDGVSDMLFVGYAQDYVGYSILEDDWWQGGYEASGAMWGPRQGEYLAEQAATAFAAWQGADVALEEAGILDPFGSEFDPYVGPTAENLGTIHTDVLPSYGVEDLVTFAVYGNEPWGTAPVARLQTADGTDVLRAGGKALTSDGQAFAVHLTMEPAYKDDKEASSRAYIWTFTFPIRHRVPGATPELATGTYRIAVSMPDGGGGAVEVASGAFEVVP